MHQMHPTIPQHLYACHALCGWIDDDLSHMSLHGYVQIRPEPSRPEKSFGGAAPSTSPDRSLYRKENNDI